MFRPPTFRRSLRLVLGALAAIAIVAPAASADTERYASPSGADVADCSPASPCSVSKAVSGAGAGDDVIVTPGDYQLTTTLATPAKITIRGVAGQPRPRLRFSGAGQYGLALGYDSLLRYVAIDQAEPTAALFSSPGRVDQVIVTGPSGSLCTANVTNSIVRDSIFVARGANGRAICTVALLGVTSTSSVRNVTAIATGSNGVAIHADASGTSTATINLVNVIARGGPGGVDLKATTFNAGAATISATHSNYGTESVAGTGDISNGGGNQLFRAPLFVNAAAGDYRQAAGSPTIDAGVNEPINGAFDFEGDPRRINTMDIGADEFLVPPAATTGPANAITGQSATLSGSVTANAIPTSYHFEYGPTPAYGNTTPTTEIGAGLSAVAAAATLGALSSATTYHYRIVATNSGGVTKGADQTFSTTGPATAPTQTSPQAPSSAGPFAGVRLVSTRLTTAGPFIALKLRCPATTVGPCTGRTTLSAPRQSSPRATATVALGRVGFSIAPGKQAKLRLRVSRPGRRLLARTSRLRGSATNTARDAAGNAKTTVAAVTIRHRRP